MRHITVSHSPSCVLRPCPCSGWMLCHPIEINFINGHQSPTHEYLCAQWLIVSIQWQRPPWLLLTLWQDPCMHALHGAPSMDTGSICAGVSRYLCPLAYAIMSICQSTNSIIQDISFVIKTAETILVDFIGVQLVPFTSDSTHAMPDLFLIE